MEIVRRCIAAFNAHDIAGWSSFLGSEFEFVDHMAAALKAVGLSE